MEFMPAVTQCLQKYVDFTGRASRSEFWWFFLFCTFLYVVAMIIDALMGISWGETGIGPVYVLCFLGLFLPSFTAYVRRLHDRNRSGWWQLILLLPLVGPIVLLVWFIKKGTDGKNRFGPDPLE